MRPFLSLPSSAPNGSQPFDGTILKPPNWWSGYWTSITSSLNSSSSNILRVCHWDSRHRPAKPLALTGCSHQSATAEWEWYGLPGGATDASNDKSLSSFPTFRYMAAAEKNGSNARAASSDGS